MLAGLMAAMFPVDLKAGIELPYLPGIFSAQVTAKEVHFQVPPFP